MLCNCYLHEGTHRPLLTSKLSSPPNAIMITPMTSTPITSTPMPPTPITFQGPFPVAALPPSGPRDDDPGKPGVRNSIIELRIEDNQELRIEDNQE
jgi:hypothetical protein